MTVEYSKGYKEAAKLRLKQIEATLDEQALAVARQLREDFQQATTKFENND